MTTHTDILIIGAGPTGLTAATLLARYGVDFRIIEKKSGPTTQSRALGVQARTLELWDKLGLADQAVRDGQKASSFNILTKGSLSKGGKPLLPMERGGEALSPYPFMLVHEQYKTEQLLLDDLHAHGGEVMWETEIASLAESNGGIDATLRRVDGDEPAPSSVEGETVRAKYVIGADGAHSFVRRYLDLPFEGDTYTQQLFLADVEMSWSLPRDKLYVEITRFGLLAFFPMRGDGYGDKQYRIVGSSTPQMANKEQLGLEAVQQTLDEYSVTGARITKVNWASSYRIHRRMTEEFCKGRFFLAGDAAHIHSPAGGQGMNTGIQDAWNLAWKLALVVRGEASEMLLESYEPERVPVARTILNGSDRGFALQASPNPVARQLRYRLTPLLPLFTNNRWAGSQLFKLVSQTWIAYRDSEIVDGDRSSKAARPGDRAPHALFDTGPLAGQSIFSLLRGVDHHLLLFVGDAVGSKARRERIEWLLARYKIDAHVHVIDGAQRSLYNTYGVQSPTALLVRPDGHIAWRGAVQGEGEPQGLAAYLDRLFMRRDAAAEALSTAAEEYLKELA